MKNFNMQVKGVSGGAQMPDSKQISGIKSDDHFIKNQDAIKNGIKLGALKGEVVIGQNKIVFNSDSAARETVKQIRQAFKESPMSQILKDLKVTDVGSTLVLVKKSFIDINIRNLSRDLAEDLHYAIRRFIEAETGKEE